MPGGAFVFYLRGTKKAGKHRRVFFGEAPKSRESFGVSLSLGAGLIKTSAW
jgi:hypothetical protein